MYSVELYVRVRRACMVDGMSIRRASGCSACTETPFARCSSTPFRRLPETQAPQKTQDRSAHRSHRPDTPGRSQRSQEAAAHRKRIYERLRDEHKFEGGYTIVKDYVRERRRRTREMFVPLHHPPGHAQCDFGEAWAVIAGVKRKIHLFIIDLPHSDGIFVKEYPAETTEAFCDGHISAFAFLGGIPQSIPRLREGRLCTTTPSWQWQGYSETAGVSAHRCSLSFSRTTCSPTGSADRARATTRVTSRGWWDMADGTSSYPSHRSRASSLSTCISKVDARRDWRQR